MGLFRKYQVTTTTETAIGTTRSRTTGTVSETNAAVRTARMSAPDGSSTTTTGRAVPVNKHKPSKH